MQYFVANPELQKHYFCSFRPENKLKSLFVKVLTPDSEIDLGIKKKIEVEVLGAKGTPIKPKTVSVPDIRKVSEWVQMAKDNADILLDEINANIEKLKF